MGEKGRRTAEEYIKIKKEEKRKFDKEHTSESNFAFHKHHYFKNLKINGILYLKTSKNEY
jgi:hypothetical protein